MKIDHTEVVTRILIGAWIVRVLLLGLIAGLIIVGMVSAHAQPTPYGDMEYADSIHEDATMTVEEYDQLGDLFDSAMNAGGGEQLKDFVLQMIGVVDVPSVTTPVQLSAQQQVTLLGLNERQPSVLRALYQCLSEATCPDHLTVQDALTYRAATSNATDAQAIERRWIRLQGRENY